MSKKVKVLVIGELAGGRRSPGTRELLGGGRDLADSLGARVGLVLLSETAGKTGAEAIAYGADEVYQAEAEFLKNYQPEIHLQVLEKIVKKIGPEILLLAQTATGRDLAPRLAYRLKTALAPDCVALAIDPDSGLLRMTRPVYGGRALAVLVCKTRPQMATVRFRALKSREPDASRSGEIKSVPLELDHSKIKSRFIEKVAEEVKGVPLEDARVVVCGGRGMGGAEAYALLEELAQFWGGAVGATRPACDSGWVSSARQIGLTGKIVSPSLYLAVALSGSSQHMAGCGNSKMIVAINKDPEANIFSFANYGVVGDYRRILPPLIQRLKQVRKGPEE